MACRGFLLVSFVAAKFSNGFLSSFLQLYFWKCFNNYCNICVFLFVPPKSFTSSETVVKNLLVFVSISTKHLVKVGDYVWKHKKIDKFIEHIVCNLQTTIFKLVIETSKNLSRRCSLYNKDYPRSCPYFFSNNWNQKLRHVKSWVLWAWANVLRIHSFKFIRMYHILNGT